MEPKIISNGFEFLELLEYPLLKIRKAFGKKQSEIVEVTGIPQQTISRIEGYKHLTDRYMVYAVTIYAICCNVYSDIATKATNTLKNMSLPTEE